jgi:hypothetical protein
MMRNIEKIKQFVETQWDPAYAYTSSDIADVLDCNVRLARYYLMEMVEHGLLRQIKYRGKTWYILYDQVEMFRQFKNIGLTIK